MDSYAWFRDLVQRPPQARRALLDASPTAACSPAARRSSSSCRRARRRADRDRLARQGEEHRPQDAGARLPAARRGSATCRSCTRGGRGCSMRSACPRSPSGSRTGAPCRRSSDSILTVCWRFGTLRLTQLRPTAPVPSSAARGGDAMIKSELVQRIATQNPHLYQRDVENIVNAILERDHRRAGARRPRRAARLRRLLGEEPPGAHRAQSAHRRACLGRRRSPCRSSRPARKCASG